MKHLRFLFFLLAPLFVSGCDQTIEGYFEAPSMYAVVSNPENYSNLTIEVIGYLQINDGVWRIFTDPQNGKLADLSSSIILGSTETFTFDCDGVWVAVKGTTKKYDGNQLKFDPNKMDYITSLPLTVDPKEFKSKSKDCYLSEAMKNSSGKVIHITDEFLE